MGHLSAAAVFEHREGICVSARGFIARSDQIAETLEKVAEWLGDANQPVPAGILDRLARELRADAGIVLQFVESFDRRNRPALQGTVSG